MTNWLSPMVKGVGTPIRAPTTDPVAPAAEFANREQFV